MYKNEKDTNYQALIANHLIKEGVWCKVSSIVFDRGEQAAEVYFVDGSSGTYVCKNGEVEECN